MTSITNKGLELEHSYKDVILDVMRNVFVKNGKLVLRVSGSSMYPVLQNGACVAVTKCSFENLKIGDIIVYQKFKTHVTIHRVNSIIKDGDLTYLRTQGDNNECLDEYIVSVSDFWGKVEV